MLVFALLAFLSGCRKPSLQDQLVIASEGGDVREIARLLSLGVNVNCKESHSPEAGTPLIWAVRCRQEKAVRALLRAGADPNIKNGPGESALFFAGAYEEGMTNIIKDLILAGANTEEVKKEFEDDWPTSPNRIAFEEAIKLRDQGSKTQY